MARIIVKKNGLVVYDCDIVSILSRLMFEIGINIQTPFNIETHLEHSAMYEVVTVEESDGEEETPIKTISMASKHGTGKGDSAGLSATRPQGFRK